MTAPTPGMTGRPFTFVVERGKVHEFALATRATHEAYFSEEPVAPVTYPTLATTFWEGLGGGAVKMDLDWPRVLHGEQEFVYYGPPPKAGTVLTGTTRVDDVFTKEGGRGGRMTFVVTATSFTDATGRVVAEARCTLIETAKPASGKAGS